MDEGNVQRVDAPVTVSCFVIYMNFDQSGVDVGEGVWLAKHDRLNVLFISRLLVLVAQLLLGWTIFAWKTPAHLFAKRHSDHWGGGL